MGVFEARLRELGAVCRDFVVDRQKRGCELQGMVVTMLLDFAWQGCKITGVAFF